MPKKDFDHFVVALIGLKDMISNLRNICSVIITDENTNVVYMHQPDSIQECFVRITDPLMQEYANLLSYHLINTVEAVGFNKALKKTKTVSEFKDDNTLYYSTEGYDITLSLPELKDYTQFTSKYHRLFRDKDLTKSILLISENGHNWELMTSEDYEALKDNSSVCIRTPSDEQLWISRGIFGNIKKTKGIFYQLVQETESDMIICFKQVENGYDIYHVLRFLKVNYLDKI